MQNIEKVCSVFIYILIIDKNLNGTFWVLNMRFPKNVQFGPQTNWLVLCSLCLYCLRRPGWPHNSVGLLSDMTESQPVRASSTLRPVSKLPPTINSVRRTISAQWRDLWKSCKSTKHWHFISREPLKQTWATKPGDVKYFPEH